MHLDLQLIYLLLAEASSEMAFLRKGNREKGCGMPNETRPGLKMMNPPQSLDFNMTEAVLIIMTENGTKGSQHPKKSFGVSFKEPGELFLKTT